MAPTFLRGKSNPVRRMGYGIMQSPEKFTSVGDGTHTAGLIAAALDRVVTVGTCPTCSLNYFKYLSSTVEANVQLATKNGVQVINMSITGGDPITPGLLIESGVDEPLSLFATVLNAAADSKIFLVASAVFMASILAPGRANVFPSMTAANRRTRNPGAWIFPAMARVWCSRIVGEI